MYGPGFDNSPNDRQVDKDTRMHGRTYKQTDMRTHARTHAHARRLKEREREKKKARDNFYHRNDLIRP